jgi:hypothetical protein
LFAQFAAPPGARPLAAVALQWLGIGEASREPLGLRAELSADRLPEKALFHYLATLAPLLAMSVETAVKDVHVRKMREAAGVPSVLPLSTTTISLAQKDGTACS